MFSKQYLISASDNVNSIDILNDGKLIITYTLDYNLGTGEQLGMMKLSTDGNLIWSKKYYTSEQLMVTNVVEDIEGNLYLCSSRNFLFQDILVIKTNPAGELIFCKQYSTLYDDIPTKILIYSNELFIVGKTEHSSSASDLFFLKLNLNGDVVLNKFYDYSDDEIRDAELLEQQLILIGDEGTFDGRNFTLFSFDRNGNSIVSKKYPLNSSFTNYPYGLEIIDSKGFAFTGDFRTIADKRKAILIKTNNLGDAGCTTETFSWLPIEDNFMTTNYSINQNTTSPTIENIPISSTEYIAIDYTICEYKEPPLSIPNIFTPNNDGMNDSYEITGLPDKFKLTIYNRWGIEVFHSSNKIVHWNGKIQNEYYLAADGTYFYVLEDYTNEKMYKGFLNLFAEK